MQRWMCAALVCLLGATTAPARSVITVNVEVRNATFTPTQVVVQPGDTVVWYATQGAHALISGLGPDDPDVGRLFGAPVSLAGDAFEYIYTELGAYPYFCACPGHVSKGMWGVVYVVAAPVPVEPTTWGAIKALFRTR